MKLKIFISLLFFSTLVSAQRFKSVKSSDTTDFSALKIRSLVFSEDSISPSFGIFDSIAINANVFFIGENHSYRAANTELQIAFIHYLHEKANLKHIVMEFGTARGWLVDHYINNQDTTYGEFLRLYSFPEYYAYYKKLRELNLSYPESKRLRVYGIDVERFNETPLKVLSLLIPDKEIPDSIALNIESILGIAGYNDNYLSNKKQKSDDDDYVMPSTFRQYGARTYSSEKTVSTIIDEYFKYQKYYQEYLGDSAYQLFDIIISELRDQRIYDSYSRQTHQHVYRERYMFSKFLAYSKLHPEEKIFGQFGRCHVSVQKKDNQCLWFDFYSIAARLNSSPNVFLNKKVSSIGYFYEDDISLKNSVENQGQLHNLLEEMAEMDTITVVKVTDDSLIFGDYSKSYDFIVYDRRPIEESSADFIEDDYIGSDDVNGNFAIGFGLRYHYPDYTSFNAFLTSKSYGKLQTPEQSFVFSMAVNSLKGFCFSGSGYFFQKQNLLGLTDSIDLTSHHYGMSIDFGWNLLNSQYVFFKPQFGMGFLGSYLDVNQSVDKTNPDLDFFGAPQISNYASIHWFFTPSAELIFKWRFMGIGISGGYLYSPFNSVWRNSQGTKLSLAPEISVNGFFWQSNFYFMFDF
ncbi:MAG: hypothetical protein JXR34_04425 [Bacteroidales bacterium]|nr:hypothetical protein [Bacteroidales bacterium]